MEKSYRGLVLAAMGLSALFPFVGIGGMTEAVIALSVTATGLLLWFKGRHPVVSGTFLALVFGFFHGQAHVVEIPLGVSAGAYAAGFLTASALLLILGVGLGRLDRPIFGKVLSVLCTGAGMVWLAAT